MTKEDILIKKIGQLRTLNSVHIDDLLSAMDEYGKYCAKKAFLEIRKMSFEDWWNEFNKTETL
jgi:hypothetical protein